MAIRWLRGGFGRPSRAIPQSEIRIPHSPPGVHHKPSEYNFHRAPSAGWSGGTLDKPWTCPGTIEPSQPPVFEQPSLSRLLSSGIPRRNDLGAMQPSGRRMHGASGSVELGPQILCSGCLRCPCSQGRVSARNTDWRLEALRRRSSISILLDEVPSALTRFLDEPALW
jgi:hypothetical protein